MSAGAAATILWFAEMGIPAPVAEHPFAPPRRWRLDFAWPNELVALEVEGGAWVHGRHVRGTGYMGDMEKYNELAARGWLLVRTVPRSLHSDETVRYVRRAIAVRGESP